MCEFHLRLCTHYAMLLINDGMGHSVDIVLNGQKGKFRALHHIGGDIVTGHGKPVGSANRTWTIGSGRGDQDLHVHGLINLGQFSHYFLTQSGVPFPHIHDILYQDIKLITGWDSIKADAIVHIT